MRHAVFLLSVLGVGLTALSATAQDRALTLDGAVRYPDGSVQTAAVPGVAPVADSGQTTCWDATGTERDCAGTGEDGEHQAGLSFVSPRFTDHGDGTVTDNQTGLMWLKDADCDWGLRTWEDALDTASDFNAGSGSAGGDCAEYDDLAPPHTDWRLPNVFELRSLVDFRAFAPSLHPLHPFLDVSHSDYWTSTTSALSPGTAWIIGFAIGQNLRAGKGAEHRVWLVRGDPLVPTAPASGGVVTLADAGLEFADGSLQARGAVDIAPLRATGWTTCVDADGESRACADTGEDGEFEHGVAAPSPRFNDRGDGTIVDNFTGLVWLRDADCPPGTRTWQQALDWVDDLNAGSTACNSYTMGTFTDWRLPNARELLSLNDLTASEPALTPGHPFVGVRGQLGEDYWTSTTLLNENKLEALVTDMSTSSQRTRAKTDGCCWVWPVRGGR